MLRAILFQRGFGNITPRTLQICGLAVPCIVSAELDSIVDARVDEMYRAFDQQGWISSSAPSSSGRSVKRGTVLVELCEEKTRRTWYSKTVE